MRKLIFIMLFGLTIGIYGQEKKCSDFKVGDFKYSNPEYSEWIINRTDSTQIETSTKTGIKIFSSVDWKSDCEYILTSYKVLNSDAKNIVGSIFHVEIIKTLADSYICISKNDAIDDMVLEMIKIK
ncbi:hypothetical protein [Algibacter aquimarinus]